MQGRRALAAIIWFAAVTAAGAQAGPNPGMGATSPLGTIPLGTILSEPSSASGSSGIPLGATEVDTPGVSPLQMPCPNTSSNSAFDGGGSTASSACGSATTNSSSGISTASGSTASTLGSTTGSGIPMGATDLGTPGESQNIIVPNVSVTPCPLTTTSPQGTSATSGISSMSGC
jgi:hypothetical protein